MIYSSYISYTRPLLQTPTVSGITVDGATNSQLTSLLADIIQPLESELTAVRPPAHPHPVDTASFPLTIFAPAFAPKTRMLSNIKVANFATEHLRCTLTSLNLLTDLQQRVVGPWRSNLAAVRSQVQSGAKSKKNKHSNNHDSERKLIAELLETLFDDMRADEGEQQSFLLGELRKEKAELEQKLSSHNKRRGRWNAIYTMAFLAVLAGSVALAAAAAPTWAMTAATVVSTAMKAAEPQLDALWDDRKAALEGEKDVIKAMVRDVFAQLHELDSVRMRMDKLKIEVGSVIERGANAGSFFFDRLKMKEEYKVEKGIEALGDMADGVQGDIKKVAVAFVRMI